MVREHSSHCWHMFYNWLFFVSAKPTMVMTPFLLRAVLYRSGIRNEFCDIPFLYSTARYAQYHIAYVYSILHLESSFPHPGHRGAPVHTRAPPVIVGSFYSDELRISVFVDQNACIHWLLPALLVANHHGGESDPVGTQNPLHRTSIPLSSIRETRSPARLRRTMVD